MEQIFLNTLSLSLSGALVGAVLLGVHPLTKKWFSKRWNYYIWLLVIVRLILPSQFRLPNSLQVPVRVPETVWLWQERMDSGADGEGALLTDAAYSGTGGEGASLTEGAYSGAKDEALQAEDIDGGSQSGVMSDAPNSGAERETGSTGNSPDMVSRENPAGWLFPAALIWLSGACLSLFMKIRSYRRFAACVCDKREGIPDGRIGRLAEDTAVRLHMKRVPDIFVSEAVSGPITLGLCKPWIVLPKDFTAEFLRDGGNLQQLSLVLYHEFIHVRRKDLWYKWLYQIVLCAHWFNPIIYFAGRMLNIDCELACDEAVVAGLTEEGKKAYGNILINTAERYVDFRGNIPSTTLLERRKDLKERLKGIIHYKKQKKLRILVSGCLSLALLYLTACGSVQVYRGADTSSERTDASYDATAFTLSTAIVNKRGIPWRMYDDDSLLAGDDDHDQWQAYNYAGGGHQITSTGFALNGSHTVLIAEAFDDTKVKVESSFNLSDGKFKTVCIKPDGSVEVIDDTGEWGIYEVTLEKGRNVIKLVGQGAKVKKLSIGFPDLREKDFAAVYDSETEEYADRTLSDIRSGEDIDKEKVLEILSYMDDKEVSEAFAALLEQKVSLTTDEICNLFVFSDNELSTKYLAEAVARGDFKPDGEMITSLMPYLSSTGRGSLIQALKEDLDWETLCDCMPYLDDDERKDCILTYLDSGNTITFSRYKEISPYLSDRTVEEIDRYLEGN